jgi:adenylosuccinate lyase
MMRDALDMLTKKLSKVISNLKAFSLQWKGNEIGYLYLARTSI